MIDQIVETEGSYTVTEARKIIDLTQRRDRKEKKQQSGAGKQRFRNYRNFAQISTKITAIKK